MNITRVKCGKGRNGALSTCAIVIDDCLILKEVNLYKGERGYFLVFPSRQDVYKTISDLNEGLSIQYPVNSRANEKSDRQFEEFFHPVSADFYEELLKKIVETYERRY